MKCLQCGYVLSNLTVNRCPECNRAFDPRNQDTFDSSEQRLTIARRLLWCALACSAYASMFAAVAMATATARLFDLGRTADLVYIVFNVVLLGVPFALLGNATLVAAAFIVAGDSRTDLWLRWSIAVAIAVSLWFGAFILLLLLLPVLAL